MSNNITQPKVLSLMIDRFGMTETLAYYVRQGKQAGARLDVALADKNALTAAKESRDLIATINTIDVVVDLITAKDKQDERPAK